MSSRERAYDVVVIGSGATGQTCAYAARDAGLEVALVEGRTLGGTCPNRGCDAKKVYVNGADAVEGAARLVGKGVAGSAPTLDWGALHRHKRSFTDPVHDATAARLCEAGVDVVLGRARFLDPHALDVGGCTLDAERVVIATGSRPAPLPFEGADLITDSDGLLDLEALPARVCFVGGGFVSFEFAHVAARAGREVTVLHRDAAPLAGFDEHVVRAMLDASRSVGIDVRLDHDVVRVEERGDGGRRVVATHGGAEVAVDADLVVHGAGRAPNVEPLDLDRAGITAGRAGIPVDAHGRSTAVAHVYAGGDVADAGHPKLLRVAAHHAAVISAHLRGDAAPTMAGVVPAAVVFTTPRLAGVGTTEREARERGHRVRVRTEPEKTWKILRESNARAFAFKTIVDEETDRVLGAFALCPGADELINLFTLAITAGLPARALKDPLFGYPTLGGHVGSMIPS